MQHKENVNRFRSPWLPIFSSPCHYFSAFLPLANFFLTVFCHSCCPIVFCFLYFSHLLSSTSYNIFLSFLSGNHAYYSHSHSQISYGCKPWGLLWLYRVTSWAQYPGPHFLTSTINSDKIDSDNRTSTCIGQSFVLKKSTLMLV